MSLNTTPRTWVAGEVVTAAEMNTEIRDAITGIEAAWTSYVPATAGVTIGNGTKVFAFSRVGKTVQVRGVWQAGSSTTYSGVNFGVALPVTPHTDYTGAGAALVSVGDGIAAFTGGAARISITPVIVSTGVLNFIVDNSTTGQVVDSTHPQAFGTASALAISVEYEAA